MPDAPLPKPPVELPSVVLAEQRTREFLAQRKWRKARDEIKPLFKANRPRYLPLLLEANLGLAREMIAKGQVGEAREVLAYLKTIAPADCLKGLEAELAARSEPTTDLLPRLAATLCDPQAPLTGAERVRLADRLVLAFQSLPNTPGIEVFAGELKAVHAGLGAVSRQRWEGLAEILRAISHRSVLSHWALFIKGLAAFHTGEPERAQRCFSALPAGSAPAKASVAYSLLAGKIESPKNGKLPDDAVIDAIGWLTGQGTAGRSLVQSEQLWNLGKHAESYRALRQSIPQFPSRGLDWVGALTDFYFSAPHTMPESARTAYLAGFDRALAQGKHKNTVEEMLSLRLFALASARDGDDWGLEQDWEEFLKIRERIHPPDPRLNSMAYGWLGMHFARRRRSSHMTGPRIGSRDAEKACGFLRRAIELDPANLDAHLVLCAVYEARDRLSERNRLLDEMTERFPEDKRVLVETARFCIQRQAYFKGLDLLERAERLDRLDPGIPDLIATARYKLARQQYERQRADKARETFSALELWTTDRPEDFHRSRWTALARQGLLEQLHADSTNGQRWLAEARAASPSAIAFLFFAHLSCRIYDPASRGDSAFLSELAVESKKEPSAPRAASLLRILNYWKGAEEALALEKETEWLKRYLEKALKAGCTRAEAKQIVELCGSGELRDPALAYVKRVLHDDPKDPLFCLFQFVLRKNPSPDPKEIRRRLEPILEEARKRGDHETAERIQQTLHGLSCPAPSSPPIEPWDLEPDMDDEDDEVEGSPDDLDDGFLDSSPEMEEVIAEMTNMLARSSEADIRRMRNTLPEHMPPEIFDTLVAMAKARAFGTPPGERLKRPKTAPNPAKPDARDGGDDSEQLNLLI